MSTQPVIVARNQNLTSYLNAFAKNNRLRWQYLRTGGASRIKVGLIITFVATDLSGRKELYVGVSKVCKGDAFELDLGLVRAIQNALPFGEFLELYYADGLPKIQQTWKNVRDEQGYITGEIEFYDQYAQFVERTKRVYSTVVLNQVHSELV